MAFTATAYAAQPQTDAATAIAMRIAMANAVIAMKAEVTQKGLENFRATDAITAIHSTVEKNDILKAAGTQQLVASYYQHVIERQNNPDAAVRSFVASLDVSSEQIAQAVNGTLPDNDLLALGGKFLREARTHLGIQTLTEDFRGSLQKPEVTRDITIEPHIFTPEQRAFVDEKYSLFVVLDELDNALSKVGLGEPRVNHLIDPPASAKENESMSRIVEAAARLKEGTSTNPTYDYQEIVSVALGDKLDSRVSLTDMGNALQDPYAGMAQQYAQEQRMAERDGAFQTPTSPEALKAFGDATLDAVARTRTSNEALGNAVRALFNGECKYQVEEVHGSDNLSYACAGSVAATDPARGR